GFISLTHEPTCPAATHSQRLSGEYGRRLLAILQRDVNFRVYLISRWLAYLGSMATGFIAVYAVEQFNLPDSVAAIFTAVLYAANVAGYGVCGALGDRLGHRRVMLFAGALWLAALSMMVFVTLIHVTWGLYVVFALMGFSNAGGVVSDFNLALEFGPETERPTYVGLTRTSTGPALLIAPILGGIIAQSVGYPQMFMTSLLFAAGGLYLLKQRVREPRHLEKTESIVNMPEAL
ncbi:MAG TPA: MFS transporter, partial [Anaerolineae bacterium]|nr:MFS transporter [Anaerolineae bacterium]